MNKFYILSFLFTLSILICGKQSFAQVCEGDMVLSSQAEVDAFACSEVTGTLTISGNDITDLDALSVLTRVGKLIITGNPSLVHIDGFPALTETQRGDFSVISTPGIEISNNGLLTTIDGFSSLQGVRGSLIVAGNSLLETINGFSSLTDVGGDLVISNNSNLKSLNGFSGVTGISAPYLCFLTISNNSSLTNLDGLSSLRTISGKAATVSITNNAALVNIDGLSSLLALNSFSSTLEISNNPALKNINGLSGLKYLGFDRFGVLKIQNNASLEDIDGLSNLTDPFASNAISGSITITQNPSLTRCSGLLPLLISIGGEGVAELIRRGDLNVSENGAGCTIEDIMAGFFAVTEFKLVDEQTGNVLTHSFDSLVVDLSNSYYSHAIVQVGTFPSPVGSVVFTIDNQFEIVDNEFPYSISLSAIGLGGHTVVCDVYSKPNKQGQKGTSKSFFIEILDTTVRCEGDVVLSSQAEVDAFQCNVITGSLTVSGQDISNLTPLHSLRSVGSLVIDGNPVLPNLNGLLPLTTISSNVNISNNPTLSDIDALRNITRIPGTLTISNNDTLRELSGFSGLTYVNGLAIKDNDKLINVDGLSELHTIGDGEYGLTVSNNASLENLDGLTGLRETVPNPAIPYFRIHVAQNPLLARCCGLRSFLIRLDEIYTLQYLIAGGYVNISGNGAGCTPYDIVGGPSCPKECLGDKTLASQAEVDAFACAEVVGNLTISGTDITNVHALSRLIRVTGDLIIENNFRLETLEGLSSLDSVGGDLWIRNDTMLLNLDALSSLKRAGRVFIAENSNLTSLDGFSALKMVDNEEVYAEGIYIGRNKALKNINGFNNLSALELLTIERNPQLVSIHGFGSLVTIRNPLYFFGFEGGLGIYGNDVLTDLQGFLSLKTIGNLTVSENKGLVNLDGFSNLKEITAAGSLFIYLNTALENLDGLAALNSVIPMGDHRPNISVTQNPSLVRCCGLRPLLAHIGATTHDDNIQISDNGSGCVLEDILACEGSQLISNFSVINTQTSEEVRLIDSDSVTIDLAHVDFSHWAIQANTFPEQVGSVAFTIDQKIERIQNVFPYQFPATLLSLGSHTVTADVYSKSNKQGIKGTSKTVVITVINSAVIADFRVVDTAGNLLMILNEGGEIDLRQDMFKSFSIQARPRLEFVGYVKFWLNNQFVRVENVSPYALNGDINGVYNPWHPEPGDYTLKATPYVKVAGKEFEGESLEIHFKVVPEAIVTDFDLVDTSGKFLGDLSDGDVIDIQDPICKRMTIVANATGQIGSVRFDLNNQFFQMQNFAPYTMTGDNFGRHFNKWKPLPGSYIITATPYTQANGAGAAGKSLTIHISVVDKNKSTATRIGIEAQHENSQDNSGLLIYPVPVGNELFVNTMDEIGNNASITIFTIQGLNVYKGTYTETGINTTDLKPGVYYLKVSGNNGVQSVTKFIKK